MIWFLLISTISFTCGCVAGGCWVSTAKPEHWAREALRAVGAGIGSVVIGAGIVVLMVLAVFPAEVKLVETAMRWWFGE